MSKHTHTPTPWGIEYTKTHLYVGPLRKDGSGKVREIVFEIDCAGLSTEALNRVLANAHLTVRSVNARADCDKIITEQRATIEQLRGDTVILADTIRRLSGVGTAEAWRAAIPTMHPDLRAAVERAEALPSVANPEAAQQESTNAQPH